ncbi:MAG: hypothetical protein QNK63_01800 [Flavobacteriales bacterium]|jgi:hypothetical protein
MKNSSILLALIVALASVSCEKDPEPPGVQVNPNTYIQYVDIDDVIEFTIEGIAGDASLRSLVISSKPEGGVTTTIFEEELFGELSTSTYVLEIGQNPVDDQLVVFTVTDEDGYTGQTARRIQLNNDPVMVESTGHDLYSNFSTENTNGFNIIALEPLFMGSLPDSSGVDIAQLDATDDDVQGNVISSYSGIKFTRNNSFNYASARQSMAMSSYDASVPLQTISNLEIDDILITRYDTLNMLHAAIKIIDIQDMPGTEEDRIIFNLKK